MNNPLSLNPGDLRNSIDIESLSTSGNAWEDAVPTWSLVCSTRASINQVGGLGPKEVLNAGELSSVSTHVITIRWTNAVTIVPGMRVNLAGKLFRIQIVQNVLQRNRVIRMFVVDLQSNAE